jgi:eukaryotic-like serine/threonine-protein kinase
VKADSSGQYASGRIYYVDANGALVSRRMSDSGKLSDEPQVIVPHVAVSASTYYSAFAVSGAATVVYSGSGTANLSQFTWFDRSGKELGRVGSVAVQANPALSPDGTMLAFDSREDVWLADLRRNTTSRFTFNPSEETTPVWSRDSTTIAYRNLAPPAVHLKKASGLEADHVLRGSMLGASDDILPNSWTADNRGVLCTSQSPKEGWGLVLVPTDGSPLTPFAKGAGNEIEGQISPDGKWVAYASNETGEWEIYVTTFPAGAGKWQVSRGGGTEPRWSGNQKEIFYIGPGQMLTSVGVSTADSFSSGAPQSLFVVHPRAPISSTDLFNYDVTKDGQRFLVNQYVRPPAISPLNIVLHADVQAAK